MRLPAAGPLDDITSACETCIKLEATHSTGSCAPGSIWPIIPSWQLEELTYKVVATLKCVLELRQDLNDQHCLACLVHAAVLLSAQHYWLLPSIHTGSQ